jgi:hypothetical protein
LPDSGLPELEVQPAVLTGKFRETWAFDDPALTLRPALQPHMPDGLDSEAANLQIAKHEVKCSFFK